MYGPPPPQPTLYPPPEWVAWRRAAGKRWAKVAECGTEAEAWEAIDKAMERSIGHTDSCVLRVGEKP